MSYKRLTKKDWHETKFSRVSEYEPNDRVILKQLWELENKIENGTLIELPCDIGDTVFYVGKEEIKPFIICGIRISRVRKNDMCIEFQFTDKDGKRNFDYMFYDNCIGDDFFLTKAEAEAKLKELQNER